MTILKRLTILLKRLLFSFLALFLLFEEWLWGVLTAFGQLLTRLLHLEKLETWLRQTSPTMALFAFSIPLLIVTPINLIAFAMIAHGHIVRGVTLEIFAKLFGTVLIARVFALTKPQLLTLRWFNTLYNTINGWLAWAHQRIRQTAVYQQGKRLKALAKDVVASFVQRFRPPNTKK